MAYPTRLIGKDNTPVSAIGFGAMGISAFYGPGDIGPDEERLKVGIAHGGDPSHTVLPLLIPIGMIPGPRCCFQERLHVLGHCQYLW